MPFKLNQDRRRRNPKQTRQVMTWRAHRASLRRQGSLTPWFTNEATEG